MNNPETRVEEDPLSREEAKNLLKETAEKWRSLSYSIFVIKEKAREVYKDWKKGKVEDPGEELDRRMKENHYTLVEEKINDIIEDSGVFSSYKEVLSQEVVKEIARNISPENSQVELREVIASELKNRLQENIAQDFLEPLLSQYIKHEMKLEGEEAEKVRREAIDHLLKDINRSLYHPTTIKEERNHLQKSCMEYLKSIK